LGRQASDALELLDLAELDEDQTLNGEIEAEVARTEQELANMEFVLLCPDPTTAAGPSCRSMPARQAPTHRILPRYCCACTCAGLNNKGSRLRCSTRCTGRKPDSRA